MMVWAPAFTIIMLLLFGHYSIFKLMRDECRLAADSHGTVRVDLAEPKVLLDERKLVVPNLITKRVYTPERVRMWCSGSSPDAYAVLVVGACGARSLLYVDEQSVRDLRAWIGSG